MLLSANVGSIKEEIGFRLNELESDNTTNYLNWINLGLQDIQMSFPNAPFLRTSSDFTLIASTRVYALSAVAPSAYRINSINDPVGGSRLSFIPPEQYDIAFPSAGDNGTPRQYTIRGYGLSARLELYPNPGQADIIHLDFQQQIPYVSAESATVGLPPQYAELLCLYGEFRGLRRRGRYAESASVQQEYEAMKERMREDLLNYSQELPRFKSAREFKLATSQRYSDPIYNQFWGTGMP